MNVKSIKINFKANFSYNVVLISAVIVLIVAFIETYNYPTISARAPRFFIIFAILFALLELIILNRTNSSEITYLVKDKPEIVYNLPKYILWIILCVVSWNYIGFFTTTIIMPFIFIILYDKAGFRDKLINAIIWTAFINIILWVLFLELLRVSSVWRLGFLP